MDKNEEKNMLRHCLFLLVPWISQFSQFARAEGVCVSEHVAQLIPPDSEEHTYFGNSIAIVDDRFFIGRDHDSDQGHDSGAVYVYGFNGETPVLRQKLLASDGAAFDVFGSSLAAYDDVLVVGAYGDDDDGPLSGSAYIFSFDGSEWVEQQKLLASDGSEGDLFGFSAAINDDVLIVGARDADDVGVNGGAAYIFRYDGATWVEEMKLLPSEPTDYGWYGFSVAISDDSAFVGSRPNCYETEAEGAVYAYQYRESRWMETQTLVGTAVSHDFFGDSLSLMDDVLVVGAPNDDESAADGGAAYVYRFDGLSWIEEQKLILDDAADYDNFADCVSAADDVIVAGVPRDDEVGYSAGAAVLFHFEGTIWTQAIKVLPVHGENAEYFGNGVTLWGDIMLIASDNQEVMGDHGAGSVSVFDVQCDPDSCAGDANGDGTVDPLDSGFVLSRFGCAVGAGDADCDSSDQNVDGAVDPLDVGYVLSRLGTCS